MRVLVTGGAGFIGSHVCDALLARGHEVLALDDLSSGKLENLHPGVRLIVADVRSAEAAGAIQAWRPQALCHLAAQISVRHSVEDPGRDADCNVLGLINVLEAARRAGAKKVVFSSTGGAIYGEQDVHPAAESHALRPASPYGCAKAAGELYLGYYHRHYGLEGVALRYANVYGPRQDPHGEAGVVAIFSQRLLAGRACDIYGTGAQTRDFVYVADVARANVLALEGDFVGTVNIGTAVETSINRLYWMLARAAGTDAAPRHLPAKPGEQLRSSIDPSLASRALGWRPLTALGEGLRATLDFFREPAVVPSDRTPSTAPRITHAKVAPG
jgi:UDP-glucose 4-epimerase